MNLATTVPSKTAPSDADFAEREAKSVIAAGVGVGGMAGGAKKGR
jgi:hypothetical protein